MTTWKEAIDSFRSDRDQAMRKKAVRDSKIENIEIKVPRHEVTGHKHKLFNENLMYSLTLRNYEIKHKIKKIKCAI